MAKPKLLDGYLQWPDEFAAEVGKSSRTVQRWRRLGLAPRITVCGNFQAVGPDDARDWLRSRREAADAVAS
jgi:hypothetical protein